MSDPAYKDRQRAIQAQVWDDAARERRSKLLRDKWADPEYRAKLLAAHAKRTRKVSTTPPKAVRSQQRSLRMKELWSEDPDRFLRNRVVSEEQRRHLSTLQAVKMADPEERVKLAHRLSKYRDRLFLQTGRLPSRDGKIRRALIELPAAFHAIDAIRHGWQGADFDEAIKRGLVCLSA